jgi:hypothetical protein
MATIALKELTVGKYVVATPDAEGVESYTGRVVEVKPLDQGKQMRVWLDPYGGEKHIFGLSVTIEKTPPEWTFTVDPAYQKKVDVLKEVLKLNVPEDIVYGQLAPLMGLRKTPELLEELKQSGREAAVGKGRRRKTRRDRKTRRS